MKTPFDCPFPVGWTADDLADAVPRRLSALFAPGIATARDLPHLPASTALAHRYPVRSNLPTLFQVR